MLCVACCALCLCVLCVVCCVFCAVCCVLCVLCSVFCVLCCVVCGVCCVLCGRDEVEIENEARVKIDAQIFRDIIYQGHKRLVHEYARSTVLQSTINCRPCTNFKFKKSLFC